MKMAKVIPAALLLLALSGTALAHQDGQEVGEDMSGGHMKDNGSQMMGNGGDIDMPMLREHMREMQEHMNQMMGSGSQEERMEQMQEHLQQMQKHMEMMQQMMESEHGGNGMGMTGKHGNQTMENKPGEQ